MNGAEHYRMAELALEIAGEYDLGFEVEQWYLRAAKVHALLALAAGNMPVPDAAEGLPQDGAR